MHTPYVPFEHTESAGLAPNSCKNLVSVFTISSLLFGWLEEPTAFALEALSLGLYLQCEISE